ncbi:helix-turn-helix transcriptional regulator [Salmonella enterica]|nr:helix-turn-helix transcriptional regulator [Salmonella enterica]
MNEKTQQSIPNDTINSFSKRLREGIGNESVRSFAKRCGLSDTAIRAYLSGKSLPTIDNLATIASITGRSVSWLIYGKEENLSIGINNSHNEINCYDSDEGMLNIIRNFMTQEEKNKALQIFRKGGLKDLMPAVVEDEPQKSVESVLGRDLSGRANAAETEEEQAQVTRKGKVAG